MSHTGPLVSARLYHTYSVDTSELWKTKRDKNTSCIGLVRIINFKGKRNETPVYFIAQRFIDILLYEQKKIEMLST